MEDRILRFTSDLPPVNPDTGFEAAVQRVVQSEIAKFAEELLAEVEQNGSHLAAVLRRTLKRWAQPAVRPLTTDGAHLWPDPWRVGIDLAAPGDERTVVTCGKCNTPLPDGWMTSLVTLRQVCPACYEDVDPSFCAACGNTGYDYSRQEECRACPTCHHDHETGAYAGPPVQEEPKSPCCQADTFVEDGKRRVCRECGCTRPL